MSVKDMHNVIAAGIKYMLPKHISRPHIWLTVLARLTIKLFFLGTGPNVAFGKMRNRAH